MSSVLNSSWKDIRPIRATESREVRAKAETARVISVREAFSEMPSVPRKAATPLAKMMGGAMDMAMAAALVEIFNGHFFKGAGHLIGGFFRKNKAEKQCSQKLAEAGKEHI